MANTSNDPLDRMQFRADPLADDTIRAIMGPWAKPADVPFNTFAAQWQAQWNKLDAVTGVFADWTTNQNLTEWQPHAGLAPEITGPLTRYAQAGRALPAWADRAKIKRAEELFMDYGALSVTLLFCASLPECYVIPDLSAVLHATGQLEKHVDYRIRATGAMVFPVMMHGGLTDAEGGGIAQIFKVRLIHATVRNLILRTSPEEAVTSLNSNETIAVPPLGGLAHARDMHQTLFAHGWEINEDGLPCNQEELAYTLLTFSYVYLRGLRTLGLGFARADEEAYLHTWNVAGHMLGVDRELMADTMQDAEKLFARMQARGREDQRAQPIVPDPRPLLGNALIDAMEKVIPLKIFKWFPLLMTRHLVGPETSKDLGLITSAPWFSRVLFKTILIVSRLIDGTVRFIFPEFSIARFFTRILGYQLITRLLMSQTRKLKLPQHLHDRIDSVVEAWSDDSKAPGWLNKLEDQLTASGSWKTPAGN